MIQYWHDLYSQETGTTPPLTISSVAVATALPISEFSLSNPPMETNVTTAVSTFACGSGFQMP